MQHNQAIAIRDALIGFVSLVGRAANRRRFLVAKAENGQARFSTLCKVLKVDGDTHYVTGIVYEPLSEDTQGHYMTEAEIRKAAYWFAKNGDKVDLQHSFEPVDGVSVVESYVTPCDINIGGALVAKGAWVMTVEVQNPDVWDKVQKGELTGFSMGGTGTYVEGDGEAEEADETEAASEAAVTREALERMVERAVAKAMAPVLKSRGLPSNLDGAFAAQPPAGHYLGGIL